MTNYHSNEMKICTQCGQRKPLVDFNRRKASCDGLSAYCKECKKKYSEAYYEKHKKEYYLRNKRRREANPEETRAYQKRYYLENREQILRVNFEYRKKNKEKIRQWQNEYNKGYRKERRKNDALYTVQDKIRGRIFKYLHRRGHIKHAKTLDILGCESWEEIWAYLLSTWKKNYGESWHGQPYHVDHIVPLVTAKTEEDVLALFHYSNLQMLTPEDNLKKGGHYEPN